MLKGHLECERIVEPTTLLFHAVLIIAYVLAISLPPKPTLIVRFYFRIYQWLHALIVATLWFDEVDDVELIGNVFASVLNLEEEPLGVVVCTVVILKYEIVLELANLDSPAEVARLETALENEGSV